MTTLEFCRARRKAELPAFVKVLKAMPQAGLGYRPDPRSRTAAEIAWLLACEEQALAEMLNTGVIDWKETPPPAKAEEIVATFEKGAALVDERLAKVDAAGWDKPAKFLMGGQAVWEDTTGQMVWGFLFDAIHHRGQLSAYLRPMGGKVPAIYGPSADDSGQ
jgi:uncharacterized damage-inducible protein DinB